MFSFGIKIADEISSQGVEFKTGMPHKARVA
jgi:hypothetical protein